MYSDDLRFAHYADNTIKNYCAQVELFLRYFNSSVTKPSEISEKRIKEWLMLAKTTNSMKHRISAVKLFYELTGKQPLKFRYIKYPRSEKHLPKVIDSVYLLNRISKISNIKSNVKNKVAIAASKRGKSNAKK